MVNEIIHTRVFDKNAKAYKDGAGVIVNQGGTRSSKSYSILQLLFYIALGSKKPLVISVVSRALPHLKLGAMRDFDNIIEKYGMVPDNHKNKSDNYYRLGKSIVEFFGTDSVDKVHGPQRDILFVNEANFIKKDVFDQLAVRTEGTIFIDYNPSRRFWYHDEIQDSKQPHAFIQSTYLDNNCLSAQQVARIEAKRHNDNWWRVYGLGELGRLEGAILTNWEYGDFDNSLPFCFGMDFGANDPDTLIRVAVDRKNGRIYWKEELYQNNLTTSVLTTALKARGVADALIVADSSAARTIMDLKAAKLNVVGASKPNGSILAGIKLLQDYQLIIDPDSVNLARELESWVWVDKRGGIPIDDNNHCIDAGRYATMHTIKPVTNRGQRVI